MLRLALIGVVMDSMNDIGFNGYVSRMKMIDENVSRMKERGECICSDGGKTKIVIAGVEFCEVCLGVRNSGM